MNQQIHEEAAEWLVELQGQPDAATRQRFDQWLATSPEHVRAYLECTAIVEAAAAAPRGTPREIEELIARAEQSSSRECRSSRTHACDERGRFSAARRVPEQVVARAVIAFRPARGSRHGARDDRRNAGLRHDAQRLHHGGG